MYPEIQNLAFSKIQWTARLLDFLLKAKYEVEILLFVDICIECLGAGSSLGVADAFGA